MSIRRLKVFLLDTVKYKTAWRYQRAISEHLNNCRKHGNEEYSGYMIVLQHESVYTIGKGGDINNLLKNYHQHSIYRVERGGDITWHGPGQLTIYPILNLDYFKRDLHWHLRNLEETVLDTLSIGFNITGSRSVVNTGVWLGNNKISAIGVTASRWITMHGCSINVNCDLDAFKQIIPCGIADPMYGVTSLSQQLMKTSVDIDLSTEALESKQHQLMMMASVQAQYLLSFSKIFDVDITLGDEGELTQLVLDYPAISSAELISL